MLQLVNKTGTVGTNLNNEACSHNHRCPGSIEYYVCVSAASVSRQSAFTV